MIIGPDRQPRLQVGDDEPFAIESCEIRREVDHSLLTATSREGEPVSFTPGSAITLWAGPSVVFQGRAVSEHDVLDQMSCAGDDDETSEDELI
jgi:hypothetical protein